jgi:hypothetical protein
VASRLDPDKPRFRDLAFVSLSVVNCLEAVYVDIYMEAIRWTTP